MSVSLSLTREVGKTVEYAVSARDDSKELLPQTFGQILVRRLQSSDRYYSDCSRDHHPKKRFIGGVRGFWISATHRRREKEFVNTLDAKGKQILVQNIIQPSKLMTMVRFPSLCRMACVRDDRRLGRWRGAFFTRSFERPDVVDFRPHHVSPLMRVTAVRSVRAGYRAYSVVSKLDQSIIGGV
jgi:hypothetical protein